MSAQAPIRAERRRWPKVTRAQRTTFLERLAAGYTVTAAAESAGRNKRRFYDLRDADEAFAAEWTDSYDAGTDVLREEARRRGVDGWDEPVFQGGQQVGVVRKYSDRMLELELKRRDPAYRENHRLEVTGANGGPVAVQADYTPTSLADVLRLARELGVTDVIEGEAVEAEPLAIEVGS